TGRGQYVDDLNLPGALHITFVRSPWAHAKVTFLDTSAAAALDGVEAFSAADLELPDIPPPPFVPGGEKFPRAPLAKDRVRFAGDIVAVVVAPTREASADAAELVEVEYEPLPVVVDSAEAARDETLLFEEAGTNTCLTRPRSISEEDLFSECPVVIEGAMTSQRLAAAPIEPRSHAAQVEDDGRMTVWL